MDKDIGWSFVGICFALGALLILECMQDTRLNNLELATAQDRLRIICQEYPMNAKCLTIKK